MEDLTKFKDIHKGDRCFIIGAGPSLNYTNFNLIRNEILFGVNTVYRGMDQFGISCRYYGVADHWALDKHYKEISKLNTTLFLSTSASDHYSKNKEKFSILKNVNVIPWIGALKFSYDISVGGYWGGTVIYDTCLHTTYYMGFKEVYLLGVDCDFVSKKHFYDDMLDAEAEGFLRSVDPGSPQFSGNWGRIFASYQTAKNAYDSNGRIIINCTVGGKLEVFKRKTLEEVMS